MERDNAYLLDMLLAARRASKHVSGLDESDFAASLLHQDAAVRQLQILGEAAWKVSSETKAAHAEIEWHQIAGMRHRLVHDYRHIRTDVVWGVLKNEIPLLISFLQRILPKEGEER